MNILKVREEVYTFFKNIVKENALDGIVLMDFEGLPLISYLDETIDEETISASGAAMVSAGLITTSDANKKDMKQIIVDTEEGYIVFIPIGMDYIVGILTPKNAKLGIIRVLAKEIEEMLRKVGEK